MPIIIIINSRLLQFKKGMLPVCRLEYDKTRKVPQVFNTAYAMPMWIKICFFFRRWLHDVLQQRGILYQR